MHDAVHLGLDLADDLLPLTENDVLAGYQRYGLSVRQPLRALCGIEPLDAPKWEVEPHWSSAPVSVRRYPPLPRRSPVLQDMLF